MSEPTFIILLFLGGVVILVAEIFLPSHGILSVVGLVCLGYAIIRAYGQGATAGHVSLLTAVVLVPILGIVAIKTFHRTPFGRLLAPPNPTARVEEFAPQHEALKKHIGQIGQTTTHLRPIGTCKFGEERVNCVAESGVIDKDVEVEAVGIRGNELEVRPTETV